MDPLHEFHTRLERAEQVADENYSRQFLILRADAERARELNWWPSFADELRRITIQYIDAVVGAWFSGVHDFDLRWCNERAASLIEWTYENKWLPAAAELAGLLTRPDDRPTTPSRLFAPFWLSVPKHFFLDVPVPKGTYVDDEHERHCLMFAQVASKKWDVFEAENKGRVTRSQLNYYLSGDFKGHISIPEKRSEIEAAIREFSAKHGDKILSVDLNSH